MFPQSGYISKMQKPKHYHTAHLFYEKPDVKSKVLSVIQNFAITKDYSCLKMGKLAGSFNLRNPTYKLSTEEDSDVEHGFTESFCQLFSLCERLRKTRQEIAFSSLFLKRYRLTARNIKDKSTHPVIYGLLSYKVLKSIISCTTAPLTIAFVAFEAFEVLLTIWLLFKFSDAVEVSAVFEAFEIDVLEVFDLELDDVSVHHQELLMKSLLF